MFWDESTDALTFGFSDSGPTATTLTPNTTKTLNSYFVGNVGIGTASPATPFNINKLTATVNPKAHTTTEFIRLRGDKVIGQTYAISGGIKLGGDTGGTATADGRIEFYANDGADPGNSYGDVPDNFIMCMRGDGNVGIGTASPQEKFHLYGSPMIQHETRYSASSNPGWYKLGTWDGPDASGSRLKISLLGGESYSANSAAKGGETIIYASINNNNPTTVSNMSGSIHAYGNPVITQAKFKQVGADRSQYEIYAYVESFTQHSMKIECTNTSTFTRAWTGSTDPGADSSTVQAALFTHVVDNVGYFGIGTASPVAKLHVASHGPTYTAISGNDRFRIEEVATNGNKFGLQMGIDWGSGNSTLQTYFLNSGGTYSQSYNLLLQPHGGNVGIGTASPGEKLHVHENLSTSGHQIAARIGGSASASYNTLVFGTKDGRPHIGGHRSDYGTWAHLSLQNDLMIFRQDTMRVGINTTSPAYPLDVSFAGDSGAAIRSTTSHASLNFFPSSGYSYLRFNEGNGSASVWLQALSGGHLSIRPQGGNETFRFTSGGDMNCNYGDLNFGNRTTQHLNLWGTSYGIGVQSNTLYFRSSDHFVFHENGTHSDSALDPGSGGALRMVIRSGGNVGINTATPGNMLHVHQGGYRTTKVVGANTFTWDFGIGNSEFFVYKPGSTGVYLAWGHTAWSANSDSRLKKNIVEIESGLQKLRNIRPVLYHLKNEDSDDAKKRSGFIAQDWLEQQPECVTHSETDNMMGIAYTDTIPVICAATKELDVNQQKIKEVIDNLSDFTGHHRCLIKNILPSEYAKYEGLIASANNNEYMNHDGSTTATINEALPVVSLTTKEKDKSCLGVISLRSDPESHLPDDPTRVKINAVGEGGIWVTDINGPLESGDYITTSNVSGYGMKQESEFLANYTVAKVTQDCDFTSPIRVVKNVTKELSNVTYYTTKIKHSITREEYDETQASIKDIEYSNVYVKYELDYLVEDSNVECDVVKYRDVDGEYTSNVEARHTTERWKTKREFLPMDKKYDDLSESEKEGYVLETKTTYYRIQSVETKIPHPGYQTEVRQEWVNVLDEHGQLQWEDHPTETEKAYKIRYLDADGKITTEANKVHTAAFVGCTYHCG
jgi:hypothetical protein